MILVEQSTVPEAALPVAELRDYLRLGTGFADDTVQDATLATCLRASLAAVEARTGKILFQRQLRWSLTGWRLSDRQVLPVAPVVSIDRVAIADRHGSEVVLPNGKTGLERDAHRPALVAFGSSLPSIPTGGTAEVDFTAGYSSDWAGVPPALAKAVLMLASHYYENRHAMAFEVDGIPPLVGDLLLPFLNIRLFGGGRA